MMTESLPPCPFCGKKPSEDLIDTCYPNGTYWREEDGLRHYIRHKERLLTDNRCWLFHCNESEGGCGAELTGDSRDEVIEKWKRRPK
jgi:hypothetical protein